MIIFNNVTKYYKTKAGLKYILKDITLEIPSNKNIGILGKNGSGKSTLLRMMSNVEQPNSGIITSDKTMSWPMALSGGFQGSLSGRENAKFICRIYGKKEKELNLLIDNIHEYSELENYFDMPVKTYSNGMKAKLGFALSISFFFNYYLIDETLSVGDKNFREKCNIQLGKLQHKSNLILVTHDMNALKSMCDVALILDNGNLSYYDNINQAIKEFNQ